MPSTTFDKAKKIEEALVPIFIENGQNAGIAILATTLARLTSQNKAERETGKQQIRLWVSHAKQNSLE